MTAALEVPVASSGRSGAVTVELGGSRKIGGRRTQEVLSGLLAGALVVVEDAAGTLLKSASFVAPVPVAAAAGLSAWLEVSVPEVPGSAVTAAAAAALSSRRLSVFVL